MLCIKQYHGGTNFGRTAGGPFITTSYDYDAPIDEYGESDFIFFPSSSDRWAISTWRSVQPKEKKKLEEYGGNANGTKDITPLGCLTCSLSNQEALLLMHLHTFRSLLPISWAQNNVNWTEKNKYIWEMLKHSYVYHTSMLHTTSSEI
jgi:hypothetical protein